MSFQPVYYKGQEIITTYIDRLAQLIFKGVLIERVAFLYVIALFLTIAQLLFDYNQNKYMKRAGFVALIFLNYPLIMYLYWMITLKIPVNLLSISYWTYIFDFIVIIFYFVFIWFSFFVSIKWMTRYIWPFFVSTIILIVDMFLYMISYNETILVFGLLIVLFSSFLMWGLILSSNQKHNKN